MHALEEQGHGARVESGFFKDGHADTIRFLLILSREVELVLHGPGLCADDAGGCGLRVVACGQNGHSKCCQRGERVVARAGNHVRIVVLRDVRDFVAQHRGEFGLALCQLDQSRVDAYKAAGQGKGVDGVIVDGKKFKRLSGFRTVGDEPSTELVEVVGDLRIVHVTLVGTDLEHALFADLTFHLRRDDFLGYVAHIRQAIGERKKRQG